MSTGPLGGRGLISIGVDTIKSVPIQARASSRGAAGDDDGMVRARRAFFDRG